MELSPVHFSFDTSHESSQAQPYHVYIYSTSQIVDFQLIWVQKHICTHFITYVHSRAPVPKFGKVRKVPLSDTSWHMYIR